MDAEELLHDWLQGSALRPSTSAEYAREIGSFLTWCRQQQIDALTARPKDIAAWSADCHLAPLLDGRPFNGPDALAWIAEQHPEAARSHDRRITALTQFYEAAHDRQVITIPPQLTVLRSGVLRPAGAKNRLNRMERGVLFYVIGNWGPAHSKFWQRDQLAVWLLLEGLRPAHVIRVTTRHLYPQPDGTYQVRAPDEHENVGKQFVLEPLTAAAVKAYLKVRPEPAEPGEYALLLNKDRRALQSRWVNKLVGQMAATHPLLADREPPVTADTIAHTGFWDAPEGS